MGLTRAMEKISAGRPKGPATVAKIPLKKSWAPEAWKVLTMIKMARTYGKIPMMMSMPSLAPETKDS